MNGLIKQILEDVENLPETLQKETLGFVRLLKKKIENGEEKQERKEPNGTKLARLMQEAASKNLFSHIKDPAKWQREIRKDRPLPGRET